MEDPCLSSPDITHSTCRSAWRSPGSPCCLTAARVHGYIIALASLVFPSHFFSLPMNQSLHHVRDSTLALLRVVATLRPSLLKVLKWALIFVSITGVAVLRRLLVIWLKAWRSPLRALPGPKSKSWFLGNFELRFDPENALPHERWITEYGTTFSYAGLLNVGVNLNERCCPYCRSETPSDDSRRPCFKPHPQAC